MLISYIKKLLNDKALMKSCLVLAIPIMLQQLVVSSVNLVDNLMVGMLGDSALSAVVSANKYYNIINFASYAITGSCTIFMAQYFGAENHKKMKETFRFSFVSTAALISFAFIIIYCFPEKLIGFITPDLQIINDGTKYLSIAVYSFLPLCVILSVSSAMRVVGDSKTPMFLSVLSIILNAFLDYSLIFGKFGLPELGIEGAAIATVIARYFEAILYIIVLYKGEYVFKTKVEDIFLFSRDLAKDIIFKAMPLLVNEVLWQFGMTILLKAYSFRGSTINTAYSIATTVSDVFFVLFSGMATATTVLIGKPLGANKLDEARDNGYKLIVFSCGLSIIFGGLMYCSEFVIPYIYPNVSLEALENAQTFVKVMGVMYFIYMFNTQCYFTLRAGGDTKSTMFMDSGYMWTCNIPIVFFLAYKTTIPIILVYIIGQLTDVIKGFICYRFVRKEKWVKNLVSEK